MYQKIHEKIQVAGIYNARGFTPKKFLWRSRSLPIEQITYIANVRDGAIRTRTYSIVSKGNLYRLCFNRNTEEWVLEEVWFE